MTKAPTEMEKTDCDDSDHDAYSAFQNDLCRLINAHSLEGRTDTPDFILAEFLVEALRALEHQHLAKKYWLEPPVKKPVAAD